MATTPELDPASPDFAPEEFLHAAGWAHPRYDGHRVESAARVISELVRWSNHATLNDPTGALPMASHVNDTVGGLAAGVAGSQQLLRQLADHLEAMTTDAAIAPLYDDRAVRGPSGSTDDGHQEGVVTALSAAAALREASQATDILFAALNRARGHLGHLGHHTDQD